MDSMQQDSQTLFQYSQKLISNSSLTSLTAHTLNGKLPDGVYGQNDGIIISLQNGQAIAAVAGVADTIHQRQIIIGDKRLMSSTVDFFSRVSFTSDQIKMSNTSRSQYVHNQLYYYNNKIKAPNNQVLIKGAGIDTTFLQNLEFDPLIYHHFNDLAYTDLVGTQQAAALYQSTAVGNPGALAEIAAGAMFTTLYVPLYYILPGVFELQDKIYLTNATFTLQVAQDYQIDAYVRNTSTTAVGDIVKDAFTKTYFKFVPGQQVSIVSVQNTSNQMQYSIPFKYSIFENQYDLRSETITIKMPNVKFFSLMILRKTIGANLSNSRASQDLFALNQNATQNIILNNISFNSGKEFIYTTPNLASQRVPLQQKALENISGVRLNFPHLSFFTFEEFANLDFSFTINIFQQTAVTDYILYYYIIHIDPAEQIQNQTI